MKVSVNLPTLKTRRTRALRLYRTRKFVFSQINFTFFMVALLVVAVFELVGCGAKTSAPTITGIFVQASPSNQTAYSGDPAPQNQVSFAAYYLYSDGTQSKNTAAAVQWSDMDSWVSLSGNVATCTHPAPIPGLQLSTVVATVQISGSTFTARGVLPLNSGEEIDIGARTGGTADCHFSPGNTGLTD